MAKRPIVVVSTNGPAVNTLTARHRLLIVALIFCAALGVRLLNWQSAGNEALTVQTSVALNYKHLAGLLRANGLRSLYDASSATSNPDLMGHPPGYPILLSLVYRAIGDSDTAIQLLQITLDSLSVVIILLLTFELFPAAIGIIAGLLTAFAPQFSWNSLTLLPDSLAGLPVLLALLLIARSRHQNHRTNRSELLSMFIAGALIGVSCWLRANALLLAPFLIVLLLVIRKRAARWRPALALVGGALLIIAPLTIRNAMVFGSFIPVSLGAGQTLLEGIADYNSDGSLGLPQTDVELIRAEAEAFHRPDYANSLFSPDGIERDRARLARGVAVSPRPPVLVFWSHGASSGFDVKAGANTFASAIKQCRKLAATISIAFALRAKTFHHCDFPAADFAGSVSAWLPASIPNSRTLACSPLLLFLHAVSLAH